MKYTFKRFISLTLGLALCMFLLAGCGTTNDEKDNNNGTNNGATNSPSTSPSTDINNATNNPNTGTGAKAGTYTATAQGYSSEVKVDVTVADDGTISDVIVDASGETAELGGKAAPAICQAVKDNQTLAVDTVTGATVTSNATLTALEEALTQAGADVDALKNKTIAQNQ